MKNTFAIALGFSILTSTSTWAIDLSALTSNALSVTKFSNGEVCAIPKMIPGFIKDPGTAEKPSDKQVELCSYDYTTPPAAGKNAIAVCPKNWSSNPGTLFYRVPSGQTRQAFEASQCQKSDADRTGKKLAKLKSSTTCSYAPAIVAYYQFSKALGGAANVPMSVFRTMSFEEHKRITASGITSGDGAMAEFWKGFQALENNPTGHPKVFTDDGKYVWGALIVNPSGDFPNGGISNKKFPEFFVANSVDGLQRTPAFQVASLAGPMGGMLEHKFTQDVAQKIQMAKDMSELVLMDHVLSQQDRFGNVAYQFYYHYVDPDKKVVKSEKVKSEDDKDFQVQVDQMKKLGAVKVKELLLKDNDCGVNKENKIKAAGVLKKIHHMHPDTYYRFMQLAKALQDHPARAHLIEQLHFSDDEKNQTADNAAEAAKILRAGCEATDPEKRLYLDLDIGAFANISAPLKVNCDGSLATAQ